MILKVRWFFLGEAYIFMRNVIYMYNTFYNKEWKNIEKKREENPYYYRRSLTFAETRGSCRFRSGSIARGAPGTGGDLGLWACSTSESPTTTAAPHGSVLCASSLSGANSATLPLLYRWISLASLLNPSVTITKSQSVCYISFIVVAFYCYLA